MVKVLVSMDGKVRHDLLQYPRPQRVVRKFDVYLSGQKTEAVTTRGEKYTYITVAGVDFYVNGLIANDSRWKVVDK